MKNQKSYRMSRFFQLPMLMLGMFWLAGCSDELVERQTEADEHHYLFDLSGSIDQQCETRASELGFADRDRIGVYVVNYKGGNPGTLLDQGNHVSNMRFIFHQENDKWVPTTDIYWVDKKTHADVYGYYPFTEGIPAVKSYEFTVAYDQSTPAEGKSLSGYEASDFLWAKAANVEPLKRVYLNFRHVMAGVKVVLKEGTGFEAGEFAKATKVVAIENTIRKSVIDFATGVVTPQGALDKNIIMAEESQGYRAVVVPQTIAANKPLISLTLNGKTFAHALKTTMTYHPGKLHHFTLKINKKPDTGDYEIKLVNEQITPWENDQSSHDFEANSYVTVRVNNPGELEKVLKATAKDPTLVTNLKISGKMTTEDFRYINSKMVELKALNIKGVKLVNCFLDDRDANRIYADDVLPVEAFGKHPHLQRIILPDTLQAIGPGAFHHMPYLTSTLVIPEGVTRIHGGAFESLQAPIVLPHSLERIDGMAFYGARSRGELYLSDNITHIGDAAFHDCPNFTGHFHYPASLEYLGRDAFDSFGTDMTGELVIPQNITVIHSGTAGIHFKNGTKLKLHDGIKRIEDGAFSGHNFITPIHLPDNIEFIGPGAFKYAKFRGELNLPKNLIFLGHDVFTLTGLNGKLVIPDKLSVLSGSVEGLFNNCGISELEIPNTLEQIGERCFGNCSNLRFVKLGKGVGYIGDEAFRNLPNLNTFTCLAKEPPLVGTDVFTDVGHMAVLQVPEGSVELYKAAPEWKKFPYITAYHELAVNLREITTLNKGVTREGTVRSEGKWYVKSCPDWVTVTPMEGDELERKSEVSITIKPLSQGAGNRTGKVVFGLTGKNYTTECDITQYDYKQAEDVEIELQKASKGGREIPIFIVGEGFDAENIIDGSYERIMKEQMEHLFAIEPFKTYRDYFTVTTSIAVAPERGLRSGGYYNYSRFESFDNWGAMETNVNKVKKYVMDVSNHIDASNLNRSVILMMYNVDRFGGNTLRENDGTTICFCPVHTNGVYPYTQSSMIQREVGGVGFGKLGTEDVSHYEFIKACICAGCNALGEFKQGKANGWLENLSLSGKMSEVPWKHLIFHPKYASLVDIYEGGYNHARGVFRSESKSIMNSYLPYFNTISRESIVRRIMNYAGETYTFEKFVANDKIELPNKQ